MVRAATARGRPITWLQRVAKHERLSFSTPRSGNVLQSWISTIVRLSFADAFFDRPPRTARTNDRIFYGNIMSTPPRGNFGINSDVEIKNTKWSFLNRGRGDSAGLGFYRRKVMKAFWGPWFIDRGLIGFCVLTGSGSETEAVFTGDRRLRVRSNLRVHVYRARWYFRESVFDGIFFAIEYTTIAKQCKLREKIIQVQKYEPLSWWVT